VLSLCQLFVDLSRSHFIEEGNSNTTKQQTAQEISGAEVWAIVEPKQTKCANDYHHGCSRSAKDQKQLMK